MSAPSSPLIQPLIQSRILLLRKQRVMLDADLAQLYGVETRAVVQAVKRNAQRFPADFMFQLDAPEWDSLRSQTVISNAAGVGVGRGGRRTVPYAFTEQGVAKRLAELEMKTEGLELTHDAFSRNTRNQLKQVFDAIRDLMTPPEPPKRPIGFVTHEDNPSKPTGTKAKATGKKT